MAHSLEDFDAWKSGEFDENSPVNREDSEINDTDISNCIAVGDFDTAFYLLGQLLFKVNRLREYAKTNENTYLEKRLNEIYNLL